MLRVPVLISHMSCSPDDLKFEIMDNFERKPHVNPDISWISKQSKSSVKA